VKSIVLSFSVPPDSEIIKAIDGLIGDEHFGTSRASVLLELVRDALEAYTGQKIKAPKKRRWGPRLRICEGTIRVAASNVQCLACGAYGQRCDRTSGLAQVNR